MSVTRPCPSELEWAKHLSGAGWLTSLRIRVHAATCGHCRRELATMRAERAAFDAAPRRRQDLSSLKRLAQARRGKLAPRSVVVAALATCATFALALLLRPIPPSGLLPKGGDLFDVYVDTPHGALPLGATCATGDRLMGRYRTGHAYMLILERDSSGIVQVLFPAGGASSARLDVGEGTTPQSWVLDEVGGRECFAAFFSDTPLDASLAAEAFRAESGPPGLPGAVARQECCEKGLQR